MLDSNRKIYSGLTEEKVLVMRDSLYCVALVFGASFCVCLTSAFEPVKLTKNAGARLERKLETIQHNGSTISDQPRLTTVTEREINSYLKFQARDQIPIGVTDLYVTIEEGNKLSAQAALDLDETGQEIPPGEFKLLDYLSGTVKIVMTGLFHTKVGTGQLEVQTITVAGLPVPKVLLEKLVRYYSSTAKSPEGLKVDSWFELPAHILEVRVGNGEAVIVQ